MSVDMSQHFSTGALLRYTAPSIGMMVFLSIYGIVDGFFVSNFVSSTALAAVNFVWPIFIILGTIGYMMGTGGGAIVAKTLGEGDSERANSLFSLFVYVSLAAGALFSVLGLVLLRPLLELLGVQGAMLDECMGYGSVLMFGIVFDVLQYIFQSLVMTAGKPKLGFLFTVAAGIANMGLDWLFIYVMGWGVVGAAWATVIGCAIGGLAPLAYFALPNTSLLRLGPTHIEWRAIGKAAANGSSEMVENMALSLVSIVYNVQLMSMLGEEGVAAYGVIMYVAFVFISVFLGYSVGAAPLMSYQYGAKCSTEMHSLFKKSLTIVGVSGIVMFVASRFLAHPVALVFVGYDAQLMELTEHAFSLYSISFLLMGFSLYSSSLFTALNNGLVSAIISFVRSFAFEIGAVLLLPLVIGSDGIWLSVSLAEVASVTLSAFFVVWLGPKYGLMDKKR